MMFWYKKGLSLNFIPSKIAKIIIKVIVYRGKPKILFQSIKNELLKLLNSYINKYTYSQLKAGKVNYD
jgi:hypothetical protein